ncbi:hypothetical protein [Comamonas sp. 4034]|uniref:hypothetical protein n=1 Tax=Comamonas sp. 4034 TaxID=3156455 RepID=UPI003D22E950
MVIEKISLGAQIGGPDVPERVSDSIIVLRKILTEECQGVYSSVINEFAFVLRIDGAIESWGKDGVERVRVQLKSGYVFAEVFFSKDSWSENKGEKFLKILALNIRFGFEKMIEALKKKKIDISGDELLANVDRAIGKFLSI